MKFKYEHYYLPMFPLFGLFIAGSFKPWIERQSTRLQRGLIALGILLPPVLLASPIDIGVEKFPQLKAMIPYIQSYGTCRDTIVFLDKSQPYGSIGDYAAVLQFYTNRPTIDARCETLNRQIQDTEAAWVFASKPLFQNCASDATRKLFSNSITYGEQVLFSRYSISPPGSTDLTPLAFPYRAIADCELPKLSKSRYFK